MRYMVSIRWSIRFHNSRRRGMLRCLIRWCRRNRIWRRSTTFIRGPDFLITVKMGISQGCKSCWRRILGMSTFDNVKKTTIWFCLYYNMLSTKLCVFKTILLVSVTAELLEKHVSTLEHLESIAWSSKTAALTIKNSQLSL